VFDLQREQILEFLRFSSWWRARVQQKLRSVTFDLDPASNGDHPSAKAEEKQQIKTGDDVEDEFSG
jgi:hypothetical protein